MRITNSHYFTIPNQKEDSEEDDELVETIDSLESQLLEGNEEDEVYEEEDEESN
jgi:hypothetical protein